MADMILPQKGAVAGERKLYARKSSGLIPFSWVAGVWPGSSIIGVLTVAMFFCLFHAYTYAAIGASMPRSAADYTLGSRTLSPPLAFAPRSALGIFTAMVAGALIAWIPLVALPTLTRSMGIVFSNPSLVSFAGWAGTRTR